MFTNIQKVFTGANGFWNWLVVSSADPTNVALTVKGVITAIIPYAMTYLPYLGVHVSLNVATLSNAAYTTVFAFFAVSSAAMTLYGAVRKLVITIEGIHPLLTTPTKTTTPTPSA